ncbi:MAG: hypothetical protein M3285_06560 [Actinomycetota bacterium]|nr:hypothetical protein [Actinomycetota bacterium]
MRHDILIALGWAALIGGGFRFAIFAWAVRRGEARPEGRARTVMWVMAGIATAAGAMLLYLAW